MLKIAEHFGKADEKTRAEKRREALNLIIFEKCLVKI